MENWAAILDVQWRAVFKSQVTAPAEAEQAKALIQYLDGIESGIVKTTSAGDLDLVEAWRNERDRVGHSKDVPATDEPRTPAALKQLRGIWRTQNAKINGERAEHAKAVLVHYDQALAQAQTRLTQLNRITDALLVKAKRNEIAEALLAAEPRGIPLSRPTTSRVSPADTSKLCGYFVGKSFTTERGTEFTFKKDGTGESQFGRDGRDEFNWAIIDERTVIIKRPDKVHFMWFESAKKGQIADTLTGRGRPLTLKSEPAVAADSPPEPVAHFSYLADEHTEFPIKLQQSSVVTTKAAFKPPVEIIVEAMTDSTNLRLRYAAHQLIFNWEKNQQQLRLDGGPASGLHKQGAGKIPANKYVTIRWVVVPTKQSVYVDGELRFEHAGNYSQIDKPVSVFPANGSEVTVKSIKVQSLPQSAE